VFIRSCRFNPSNEGSPACLLAKRGHSSVWPPGRGQRAGTKLRWGRHSDARGKEQRRATCSERRAARTLSLTCLVACRLTMTSFPPLFFVISGRLPLGLICREVPRVTERSAFLRGGDKTSSIEKKLWLFAGCFSYPAPVWTLQASQLGSKAVARICSGFSQPLSGERAGCCRAVGAASGLRGTKHDKQSQAGLAQGPLWCGQRTGTPGRAQRARAASQGTTSRRSQQLPRREEPKPSTCRLRPPA